MTLVTATAACMLAGCLLGGCTGSTISKRFPPTSPPDPLPTEWPWLKTDAPLPRRDVVDCERATPESAPDGPLRLRFRRLHMGMSPERCGAVVGPSDVLAFARYLQKRLMAEPGCESCRVNRIDHFVAVDVEIDVVGRWTSGRGGDPPRLDARLVHASAPERHARFQMESAHFYFMRDAQAYEAFYEGLCPGSPEDPDAPGPRLVSEECMRFSERRAPGLERAGLWEGIR